MKIRNGFVSNSSSSSFICAICKEIESGMDVSPSDFNMKTCQSGHHWHEDCYEIPELSSEEQKTILIDHVKNLLYLKDQEKEAEIKRINELDGEDFDDEFQGLLDVDGYPKAVCPVCSLKKVRDETIFKYLVKKNGLDVAVIIKEIQSKFTTLDELEKFCGKEK